MTQYLQSLFKYVSRNAHMRVFLLLFLVLLTLTPLMKLYVGFEDRTFWGQALETGEEVSDLLISQGICEKQNKLCASYIYALSPRSGGFEFLTFGIQDEDLLSEIKEIVLQKFNKTPEMKLVIITAYLSDGLPPKENVAPKRTGLIYRQEFRK